MGCFNDPAWKVCGGGWWVADTNYLYPAHWGWINILIYNIKHKSKLCFYFYLVTTNKCIDKAEPTQLNTINISTQIFVKEWM